MRFFATTYTGLEDVAAAEISGLLVLNAETDVAKVFFDGSIQDCVKLNYAGQTVNRVFIQLLCDEVDDLADIQRLAESVDYSSFIDRGMSFAVRAERVGQHPFTSLDIAAAVGKAVIESYKAVTGVRLKVDLKNPDVEIHALLRHSEMLIGLNTTGESLHRRYYRVEYHRAALSPTIANSLVRLSGWRENQSLLDPFCGSGTIPIEAALYGLDVSPGLRRGGLALEKMTFFDREILERYRELLRSREKRNKKLEIMGVDVSHKSIEAALSNLSASALDKIIEFAVGDVFYLEKAVGKHVDKIVCNPPFGLRLGLRKPEKFYSEAFKSMKRVYPNVSVTAIVNKPVTTVKAMEAAGFTPLSVKKILMGPITSYIIVAV